MAHPKRFELLTPRFVVWLNVRKCLFLLDFYAQKVRAYAPAYITCHQCLTIPNVSYHIEKLAFFITLTASTADYRLASLAFVYR